MKGQFKTLISGGLPPYEYNWGAGYSQDTIVFGLCEGTHTLRVTDANGCKVSRQYKVEVLKTPDVPFTMVPKDTLYITNPTLKVFFADTSQQKLSTFEWDFGEKLNARVPMINPAEYVYYNTGNKLVKLFFTDLEGCKDSVTDTIHIRTVKLKIPNVFTPNGDGFNDNWVIQVEGNADMDYRESYISNEMLIFDRWGRKVYSATNYQSGDFDGKNLSDGVYYYVFRCHGEYGDDVYKGSVTIIGRGY